MVKRIALFAFIALLSQAAFAQEGKNYWSFGVAYNKMSQSQEQVVPTYKETYSSLGLSMTGFSGRSIGFYSNATFMVVQEFTAELGSASARVTDLSAFDQKWAMDAQLGIAKKTMLSDSMMLLAGGGLQYSQLVMTWTDNLGYMDGFIYGVLGVGGLVELSSELFDGFSLCASLKAGYNFYPVLGALAESGIEFGGGYTVTPSVGFSLTL
ncbi:MAG TPA: hypothetical protein DCG47_08105 [Spirochaetaceae bacterium]|jgi:hypothetical protein|nr:hypothetical protein [Spirochaetaceae bacterium]